MPKLLQALVQSHKCNNDRKKGGQRYKDELIRNFSMFSKDLGGKQIYEFWSKNLPLPSLSTVSSDSRKSSKHFAEGEFRFQDLQEYLDERGLDRYVWASEDATRCVVKIEYDEQTNQLVGLTPELDANGLPKVRSFEAKSAERIKEYFKSGMLSNYVYVIMAQPLAEVPAFCLCIFGTDSRFNSTQVEQRWKWMVKEAQKHDIVIAGFSSDGDEKLLSAMKKWTFTSSGAVLPGWESFFFAPMDMENPPTDEKTLTPICIQDIVHIGAKCKTQCLKPKSDETFMPIGDYVVSGTFLTILLTEVSKEKHGLCLSDLDSKDKMNFRSVQRICDKRVTDALDKVRGAKGLKIYLEMLRGILESFLSKNLSTYERVSLIWKSVFFFRYWRLWLQINKYSVSKNFISRNSYECIELCAHSLVNVIRRLRIYQKHHLFLPWLMSSQPCEEEFRDLRSCTPTFHTPVNITVKEFIQRHDKIERITQKRHELSKSLNLPRHHKKMKEFEGVTKMLTQEYIDVSELLVVIMEAKDNALQVAKDLGMGENLTLDTAPCFISNILKNICEEQYEDEREEEELSTPMNNNNDESDVMPSDVAEDLVLLNDSPMDDSLHLNPHDKSLFVVIEEDGQRRLVKKRTFLWFLSSKKFSLSSSRLERVKAALEVLGGAESYDHKEIIVAENLALGEWATFNNCPLSNRLYVGRILDFSYLSGTGNARRYSYNSVPIAEPEEGARGIGCLADWYTLSLQGNGTLDKFREPHKYHSINHYICTIPRPEFLHGGWRCTQDVFSAVKTINLEISGSVSCSSGSYPRKRETSNIAPTAKSPDKRRQKKSGRLLFPESESDCGGSDSDCAENPFCRKTKKPNSAMLSRKRALSNPDVSNSGGHSPKACRTVGSVNSQARGRSPSPRSPRSQSPNLKRNFPPLERAPEEGNFVLVEFPVRNKCSYYIGKVLKELDEENDIEVSYLRRHSNTLDKFSRPLVPDLASVNLQSVKMILPHPRFQEGSSKRQQDLYKFDVNLEGLNVC